MNFIARLFGLGVQRPEAAPAAASTAATPAPAPAEPPRPSIPVIAVGEAPERVPLSVPPAAVNLVARWEGYRDRAYLCPAKVWTIGYGATRWGDGRPVREGDTIAHAEARQLLARHLADAAEAVDSLVDAPLTESQHAALISFVFNIGRGAFAQSTMLMHINAGRMDAAASEFPRWVKAGGKVVEGLVKRRAEEAALFIGAKPA